MNENKTLKTIKKSLSFDLKVAAILAPLGFFGYFVGTFVQKQTIRKDELRPNYYVYDISKGNPDAVYFSKSRVGITRVVDYYDSTSNNYRKTIYVGKEFGIIEYNNTVKVLDTIKTNTIKFAKRNPVTNSRLVGYTHMSNVHLKQYSVVKNK